MVTEAKKSEQKSGFFDENNEFEKTLGDPQSIELYKWLRNEYRESMKDVYNSINDLKEPAPPTLRDWIRALSDWICSLLGIGRVMQQKSDNKDGGGGKIYDLMKIDGWKGLESVIELAVSKIVESVDDKYKTSGLTGALSPLFSVSDHDSNSDLNSNSDLTSSFKKIKESLEELEKLNISRNRIHSIGVRHTMLSLPDVDHLKAIFSQRDRMSSFVGAFASFGTGWLIGNYLEPDILERFPWIAPEKAEFAGRVAGGIAGVILAVVIICINERKASKPVYQFFDNVTKLLRVLEENYWKVFNIVLEKLEIKPNDEDVKLIEEIHQANLKDAEQEHLLVHFLKIQRGKGGDSSPEMIRTLEKLASLCEKQFRMEEADKYYEEIIKISKRVYGPEGRETARLLSERGVLNLKIQTKESLEKAKICLEQACSIEEKQEGDRTYTYLLNLALAYKYIGNVNISQGQIHDDNKLINEGYLLLNKAVEILKNIKEKGDQNVKEEKDEKGNIIKSYIKGNKNQLEAQVYFSALNNLCSLSFEYDENTDEADRILEELLKLSLDLRESEGDKEYSSSAMVSLGVFLTDRTEELEEAEKLLKDALEINQNIYGLNCIKNAPIFNALAQLYLKRDGDKDSEEAEKLLRDALEIYKNNNLDSRPNCVSTKRELARFYMRKNSKSDLEEAEGLLKECYEIERTYFGAEHPNCEVILDELIYLAGIYLKSNFRDEAEKLLKQIQSYQMQN